MKVLLIDDERGYRETLRTIVEGVPQVVEATGVSLGDSLSRVKQNGFHFVVLAASSPPEAAAWSQFASAMSGLSVYWVALLPFGVKVPLEHQGVAHFMGRYERVANLSDARSIEVMSNILQPLVRTVLRRQMVASKQGAPLPRASSIVAKSVDALPPTKLSSQMASGALTSFSKALTASASMPGQQYHQLSRRRLRAVCIGISTGGPQALMEMLPHLCAVSTIPILVVQHMPASFTAQFANSLDHKCGYKVKEAEDGELVSEKTVYIAPGGIHMALAKDAVGRAKIVLQRTPPLHNCRPAVDALLPSAGDYYGKELLVMILTGMGSDGSLSLSTLKTQGVTILAQDEATSVVWGMPGSAVATGCVDAVVPLLQFPDALRHLMLQ